MLLTQVVHTRFQVCRLVFGFSMAGREFLQRRRKLPMARFRLAVLLSGLFQFRFENAEFRNAALQPDAVEIENLQLLFRGLDLVLARFRQCLQQVLRSGLFGGIRADP